MKRSTRIALFLVIALAGSDLGHAADLHGSGHSVVDGDEFILCEQANCVDIRLCGLDTPSKGKPGYAETIAGLQKLVVGKKVLCRPVGEGSICDGLTARTSRRRTVAQCFVEEATIDVASALIAAGLGCDRVKASGGHYSKDHPEWQCKQP